MTPLRRAVLKAYVYSSLPYRRWWALQASKQGKAPVMVLFYHRVADHALNPWTMKSADFRRQLDWLAGQFDFVSLEEAQQRIASGVNYRAAVSITFDDGYADNSNFAIPLLLERQIPFTYFVTLKNMVDGDPFPHDVQRGAPLQPNTLAQIKELVEAGVEIGAHSRTHADIARCDDEKVIDEVVTAGEELSRLIDQPVRYFAFPFGQKANMTAAAFHAARRAGYQGVCSAYGGYNFPGDDPFHLQRIHADPEFERFQNWLTIDPRKVQQVKRFEW